MQIQALEGVACHHPPHEHASGFPDVHTTPGGLDQFIITGLATPQHSIYASTVALAYCVGLTPLMALNARTKPARLA